METKIELDIELMPDGLFLATSKAMKGMEATGHSVSEAIQKALSAASKKQAES